MQHWLFMFRPDTYEKVKAHQTIGVRHSARHHLAEVRKGDRFVAYVSRAQLLHGFGTIASDVFEEDTLIFSDDQVYGHRCKVKFARDGAAVPVGTALWALEQFLTRERASPTNMIFCRGGFIPITEKDYQGLVTALAG